MTTNPLTVDPQQQRRIHMRNTQFWDRLMHDIYGPRQGGAIIFVDAENARKGVGKTSLAVSLARLVSKAVGYDLEPEDFLIAGPDYVRRYREHPGKEQPSVVVPDELVGGGAGDARRAMSSANIKIGRAFQLLRKKRVVTITTLPHWGDADSRLQKQAAYRCHALETPIGTFKAYKIVTGFGDGRVRTKGLGPEDGQTRRIGFPDMTANDDPFFDMLEKKKDALLGEDDFSATALQGEDADEEDALGEDEIRREERVETAIRLYQPWNEDHGSTYAEVADAIPEYGADWVGKVVRQWDRGQHRGLVADPTK